MLASSSQRAAKTNSTSTQQPSSVFASHARVDLFKNQSLTVKQPATSRQHATRASSWSSLAVGERAQLATQERTSQRTALPCLAFHTKVAARTLSSLILRPKYVHARSALLAKSRMPTATCLLRATCQQSATPDSSSLTMRSDSFANHVQSACGNLKANPSQNASQKQVAASTKFSTTTRSLKSRAHHAHPAQRRRRRFTWIQSANTQVSAHPGLPSRGHQLKS